MSDEIQKKLQAARERANGAAAKANEGAALQRAQHDIGYYEAYEKALDKYSTTQLIGLDVSNVGLCLVHWPSDTTYTAFMKETGAIRGDLKNIKIEHLDRLLADCAIYPEPAEMLRLLKDRNPHARSVIANKLLEDMRGRLDEEGK